MKSFPKLILSLILGVFVLSGFAVAEPLHEAAKEGDLKKVKRLIADGSDVNVKAGNGATPLHYAADRGHIDIVEMHISKGANVNAINEAGMRPLMFARGSGNKDVVELLIKHGAK